MRPKPSLSQVCALLGSALALACGAADENQDAAGASELLERVRADDYSSWSRPPGFEQRTPAQRAHGQLVDLFVNDSVAAVLAAAEPVPALPTGSLIVKDAYKDDQLHAIAIMEKRSDGWYWAEYDAAGTVTSSGHPEGCQQCHRASKDYVRSFAVP